MANGTSTTLSRHADAHRDLERRVTRLEAAHAATRWLLVILVVEQTLALLALVSQWASP